MWWTRKLKEWRPRTDKRSRGWPTINEYRLLRIEMNRKDWGRRINSSGCNCLSDDDVAVIFFFIILLWIYHKFLFHFIRIYSEKPFNNFIAAFYWFCVLVVTWQETLNIIHHFASSFDLYFHEFISIFFIEFWKYRYSQTCIGYFPWHCRWLFLNFFVNEWSRRRKMVLLLLSFL